MESLVDGFCGQFPSGHFLSYDWNVYATLAIVLVGIICGSTGGLVVGNRMAFFSDALAHCAFAGVALGFVFCLLAGIPDEYFRQWVTIVMVGFGIVIGISIAWVRDRTGLASDTVIGVFFAFAVGMGAVFSKLISQRRQLPSIESFCFGDPLNVQPGDILTLAILAFITLVFLVVFYNQLVLTSVHPSLAKSRGVPVVMLRYLLIILVGLIVNLCLNVVGVLLINGLLIVPAATAANLSRNLRQHFWWTLALTIGCGLVGEYVCWEITQRLNTPLGMSGVILVLASLCFFASMALGPFFRRQSAKA